MNEADIKAISDFEAYVFDYKSVTSEYRRFNHVWIKKCNWPFGLLNTVKDIPGIQCWPDKSIKKWIKFLLQVIRKDDIGIHNLLGLFFSWCFLEKKYAKINPDIFILRSSRILIYDDMLYKVSLDREYLIECMKREINVLVKLQGVHTESQMVGCSKILDYDTHYEKPFYRQELIKGQTLHYFNQSDKQKIKKYVIDYMLEIYKSYGVRLENIDREIDKKKIEGLNKFANKNQIDSSKLNLLNTLLGQNKKMLISLVHSDLGSGNIVVSKDNKIIVIDWGASEEKCIVNDLNDTFTPNAKIFFNKLVSDELIDMEQVYSFHEQVYLENVKNIMFKYLNNDVTVENSYVQFINDLQLIELIS